MQNFEMYSTKLLHKSMVSGNAYITIGDPFKDAKPNPFREAVKPKKGEEVKPLAPFKTALVAHNAEEGNFAKLTYKPASYFETIKYITTQPLDQRKKGFGTKDANKRDEFSNDIRTEQYRETLRKEKLLMAETPDQLKDKLTHLLAERAKHSTNQQDMDNTYSRRVHQYDIGRSSVTEFDPKSSKDTYYKFQDSRPKRFGDVPKPVSYEVGDNAWNITYKPPSHGGKSEVKNFFDKSHLSVSSH